MTPDRFAQLVDAYGADPQRWPAAERAAADALLAQGDAGAQAALAEAAWLDYQLNLHPTLTPDPALARRIVASASARRPRPWWRQAGHWWSSAGIVGAALAGVLAGMLVCASVLPGAASDSLPSLLDPTDADLLFDVPQEGPAP